MQNNRRKKRANEFVISIAMHLALFGLLIWSSLYQTVEIMGGGEGEGDAMGAVMVDTGSAAQGRLVLYQLSYFRLSKKVGSDGFEPPNGGEPSLPP